jgi:hypothetical protein
MRDPQREKEGQARSWPEEQPPIPVSALVLAGVGGMLLFMGFFFGLVASLGVGGFLIPALGILAMGALMMLAAWRIWKSTRVHHEEKLERERDRLLCDYCGGLNMEGDVQCRFCGAPLR